MVLITEQEVAQITPDKRWLPKYWTGDFIRRKVHLEPNNWDDKSEKKRAKDVPGIIAEVRKVMNSTDSSRNTQWQELIVQGLVEKDADINNYVPEAVPYSVDHETDLAISWNSGGNDTNDDARRDYVLNDANLRTVTSDFNLRKTRKKYYRWVGKSFESAKHNIPLHAKAIGDKPFLDAEDGNPIPTT